MLKKILWVLLLATMPALAQNAAVQGHSFLGGVSAVTSGLNSTNKLLGIIPHATISVYYTGTPTLVPGNLIYSNATGTILGNPFTSNDATSVNPGGWLFFAAVNQGYDVVGSGGIAPNTYPVPVTLCTGCFPSSQFVVPGVTQIIPGNNVTISSTGPSGTGAVTINSTGGGGSGCAEGTCIQNSPSSTQTLTQPSGTQFLINIMNGSYFAAQFGSTNGIATAISDACTGSGCEVIAGQNYALTELLPAIVREAGGYGTGNYLQMPGWPGLTRVRDERGGFDSEIFNAPTGAGSYYPNAYSAQFPYGRYFNSAYDVTIPGNSVVQQTSIEQSIFNGPGNQINGFGGVNLKSYDTGHVLNMTAADQGQHLLSQHNLSVGGVGDVVGDSLFVVCDGGASTYNDEGCHLGDKQAGEDLYVYEGTVASVASTTAMQDTVTAGTGTQGDGRYKIDLTDAASGTWPSEYVSYTVRNQYLSPPMETFVGTSFATGWVGMVCDPTIDTCNNGSDPTGRVNSVAGGYAPGPITFTIVSNTSTPSFRTGYSTSTSGLASSGIACVADSEYFETTTYTVESSSTILLNLRKPHNDGMTVGIGGQCQTGLEVTGGTYVIGSTHYRQVWPVVGNFNGTQLIVWDHDSQQGYSNAVLGNNGTAYCSTDSNPTVFSASGKVVTVLDTTINTSPDPHFGGQTTIVTTGNSSYNGTVMLSYITTYYNGGWQPAYQYTLTNAPSGSAPTSGTIQMCNTSFNLYPAVEVLNVLNPSTNTVDGYFSVAPNSIVGSSAFTVGDSVEEPHYFWQSDTFSGGLYQIAQMMPRAALNSWQTAGLNYTNLMSGGYIGWSIENSTPQDYYEYFGDGTKPGTAPPPEAAYMVNGYWKNGVEWTQPPAIGGAMLQVGNCQSAPYNCNDPLNSPIAIYSGPVPNHIFYDNTYSNAFTFGTNALQINGLGFPATIFSPLFGTTAFSTDLSNFTPDGTIEAENFQFWSNYTPPTYYQHVSFYGDSGTSLGMQFPTNDGGVHQTYQGGNLSVGSLQFYYPNTVSAAKTAGFTPTTTVGQISCDDATPGDAGCLFLAKNIQLNGQAAGVGLFDGSGNLTSGTALPNGTTATTQTSTDNTTKVATDAFVQSVLPANVANVTLSTPAITIPATTCYGPSSTTTPGTVTMTGLTTSMAVLPAYTYNDSAVVGWGAVGGLNLKAWSSAANTVSYLICNPTGSSITAGVDTFVLAAK